MATLVSSHCDAYKYCVILVAEDLIWALTNENLREGVSKGSHCVETTRRFWVNTQNKRPTLRHLIDLHALLWRSDHPARATLIFHSKRVASNYRHNRIVKSRRICLRLLSLVSWMLCLRPYSSLADYNFFIITNLIHKFLVHSHRVLP